MDRNKPPTGDHSFVKSILARLRRVPVWAWALPCGALAVVYAVAWPASETGTGVRFLVLRWGHSLAWVLLACSFIVRSHGSLTARLVANALAVAGLLTYAAFMASIL